MKGVAQSVLPMPAHLPSTRRQFNTFSITNPDFPSKAYEQNFSPIGQKFCHCEGLENTGSQEGGTGDSPLYEGGWVVPKREGIKNGGRCRNESVKERFSEFHDRFF
jgi:hypothetical protein